MPRYRLRTLLIVVTIVAALCSGVSFFRTTRGQGVTAGEANWRLWNCLVPADATDVWFVSGPRATRVECTLDEASFRNWCSNQGWQPTQCEANDPQLVYSQKTGETVQIHEGLFFIDSSKTSPDIWHRGTYDAKHKRAYINYSGG